MAAERHESYLDVLMTGIITRTFTVSSLADDLCNLYEFYFSKPIGVYKYILWRLFYMKYQVYGLSHFIILAVRFTLFLHKVVTPWVIGLVFFFLNNSSTFPWQATWIITHEGHQGADAFTVSKLRCPLPYNSWYVQKA